MSEPESRFKAFRRKKKAQQQETHKNLMMENVELQTEVMKLRLQCVALNSRLQTMREFMAIPSNATIAVAYDPGSYGENETQQDTDEMVKVEDDGNSLIEFEATDLNF